LGDIGQKMQRMQARIVYAASRKRLQLAYYQVT